MNASQSNQSLIAGADVLVPETPSGLSLAEALTPEDFYLLNSLSKVSIQGDLKQDIALSDLVLELSHFVDNDTVRKVELSFLEQKLKDEWELAQDFSLVEKRNKEIDLVMKEIEEVSWRAAGQFD